MNKTKEQLQDRITELETYIADSNNAAKNYASELASLKKDLEDINKPVIDWHSLDRIYDVIYSSMEALHEIDPSDCEFDFGIDYDGRITVESMQILKSPDDFCDSLYNDLKTLFKVNEKEKV